MAKKTKSEAAPAPAAKVAKQAPAEPPAVSAKAVAAPAPAPAAAAADGAATKQQKKKGKAANQSQSGGAAGAAANKTPAATAEAELKETVDGMALGKRLADNDKYIRDKSVAVVRRWLAVHPEANESDYKKLWKALFYCMWMSDKVPIQQELAQTLAELMTVLQPTQAALFFRVFVQTMQREWNGLDKHRVDKFFSLLRKFLRQMFAYLAQRNWDGQYIELFNPVVELWLSLPPHGMRYHLTDCFVDELVQEASALPASSVLLLLQPFFKTCRSTDNRDVYRRVLQDVLERLLSAHEATAAQAADDEQHKPPHAVPSLPVHDLGRALFDIASDPSTVESHRKALYTLQKRCVLAAAAEKDGLRNPKRGHAQVAAGKAADADGDVDMKADDEDEPAVQQKPSKKQRKAAEAVAAPETGSKKKGGKNAAAAEAVAAPAPAPAPAPAAEAGSKKKGGKNAAAAEAVAAPAPAPAPAAEAGSKKKGGKNAAAEAVAAPAPAPAPEAGSKKKGGKNAAAEAVAAPAPAPAPEAGSKKKGGKNAAAAEAVAAPAPAPESASKKQSVTPTKKANGKGAEQEDAKVEPTTPKTKGQKATSPAAVTPKDPITPGRVRINLKQNSELDYQESIRRLKTPVKPSAEQKPISGVLKADALPKTPTGKTPSGKSKKTPRGSAEDFF